VLELGEYLSRGDDVADAGRAGGDALQGAPAAGEQGEAALAEGAGGAVQPVVALMVDGQNVAVGRLLDRGVDAVAGAVVAPVGESTCSRAAVMSCSWPAVTSEVQIGNPSGRMIAWMLPPNARCLPEYQA
jgi:hypothetical protein